MYEKDETRTYVDNSSHDEKYGVTNTEEVRRFDRYYVVKVGRFVEFDNKPDILFAVTGKILVLGSLLTKLKLSTQVKAVHKKQVIVFAIWWKI